MLEVTGDIWDLADAAGGWVVVTTNGVVDQAGHLVMGAGLAGQAKTRHPDLPTLLGRHVRAHGNTPAVLTGHRIATWPTKPGRHTLPNHTSHPGWMCATRVRHPACQREVARTTWVNGPLLIAALDGNGVTAPVFLPRPGCGLGGLDWAKVGPWLTVLLTGRGDQFTVVSPPPSGGR